MCRYMYSLNYPYKYTCLCLFVLRYVYCISCCSHGDQILRSIPHQLHKDRQAWTMEIPPRKLQPLEAQQQSQRVTLQPTGSQSVLVSSPSWCLRKDLIHTTQLSFVGRPFRRERRTVRRLKCTSGSAVPRIWLHVVLVLRRLHAGVSVCWRCFHFTYSVGPVLVSP